MVHLAQPEPALPVLFHCGYDPGSHLISCFVFIQSLDFQFHSSLEISLEVCPFLGASPN
jgi:hypothetical protein